MNTFLLNIFSLRIVEEEIEKIIDGKNNIEIYNNIFDGPCGRYGISRGYIFFRPLVHGITVRDNYFLAPEKTDSPAYGIISENPDKSVLVSVNNVFSGKIDKEIS